MVKIMLCVIARNNILENANCQEDILCVEFSYFYYSDNAISYTEYIMGYNNMAQPHGLTRSL